MSLQLYGHPFSSYTWKALIPLYANGTAFEFRGLGPDDPVNNAFVVAAHPAGKFPVLVDDDSTVIEPTMATRSTAPAPWNRNTKRV